MLSTPTAAEKLLLEKASLAFGPALTGFPWEALRALVSVTGSGAVFAILRLEDGRYVEGDVAGVDERHIRLLPRGEGGSEHWIHCDKVAGVLIP